MKLLRKQISGNTFVDEATSGIFPHKAQLTTESGWDDVTGIENWDKYGHRAGDLDYIYMQLRISEGLQAKAGATDVDKWNNCTDAERDIILKYNQFKGISGGAEDVAKVTHLITTGQAADSAEAADWLRKNHARSVAQARPCVKNRVENPRLTEVIIKYLNPADTQQLLATIAGLLNNYRDYVLVGTVIPGNEPGIHDYINSTDIYTGNGLVEGGWTPQTGTLTDLMDRINDILFGDNTMII